MRTVYKYPALSAGTVSLSMPEGAEVLFAHVQHGQPVFWALVDPERPLRDYQVSFPLLRPVAEAAGTELTCPVEARSVNVIALPDGAVPTRVEVVGEEDVRLVAVAPVPGGPLLPRRFRVAATGEPIGEPSLRYIDSFLLYAGGLVFHLFEMLD